MSGLYPAKQPFPAERRAAVRSAVSASLEEPTRRRRARWLLLPVPAAVIAVAVLLTQAAAPAATWAAVPEGLDSAAMAQLGADCTKRIADRHFPITVQAATPVLGEARGTSKAVLLGAESQAQICIDAAEWDFLGVYSLTPLPDGAAGAVEGVPGSRWGGDPLRAIFGRVRIGSQVVVQTADGRQVTASVSDGQAVSYFLAWWPSHADATGVTITSPAGVKEEIPVPDQGPPAPTSGR